MTRRRTLALAVACGALLAAACGSPAASQEGAVAGEVTVFAASSLSEAFSEMGVAFEARHSDARAVFNFAGTPTLRTQLEQGARADVFASANEPQMELAVEAAVVRGGPAVFATNQLVVIAPVERAAVASLADLGAPGVKLVLALALVPAGAYARDALGRMDASGEFGGGFEERALGNLVSEETNVRQVAAKVALGEADAGIVYRTDVTPDIAGRVRVIVIPSAFNVEAAYPFALVADAPNPNGGEAFMDFVLSDEGRAILEAHGFGGPAE